ncbi:MAG: hypothetical protein LBL61_01335 [Elusimicrobiota bacterium]|nr:hypothetical protein [Elusimicrobiota bacterium]
MKDSYLSGLVPSKKDTERFSITDFEETPEGYVFKFDAECSHGREDKIKTVKMESVYSKNGDYYFPVDITLQDGDYKTVYKFTMEELPEPEAKNSRKR